MTHRESRLAIPVTAQDHGRGAPAAAVTIVEYGDYQCPACADAYPVVRELIDRYGDDVRFVFRNFPLQQIHTLAVPAAEIAEGAGLLDDFWTMHDWLYEHQDAWSRSGPEALLDGVAELNLDRSSLDEALRDPRVDSRIRDDFSGGVQSGVHSTPSFFINGRLHEGDHGPDAMSRAIDAALAAAR